MSLEIFPTFPKIRAEQLSAVDWTQVAPLMDLINKIMAEQLSAVDWTQVAPLMDLINTANSAANDTNIANAINTGANTQAAINNRISAQVNQSFLDPLVSDLVNNETSQTRTNLNAIINNAVTSAAPNYNGQVNGGETDWNTLTTRGYYLIIASGTGGSNIPPVVAQDGILLVLTTASGGLAQIFLGHNGAYAYRYYNGSAWGPWYGRSNTRTMYWPPTINLDSTTYKTLYTFRPSSVLWAGSSGFIFVQVFGQLLYFKNSASRSYIRLRLSSSPSGLGLSLIRASATENLYPLTLAGAISTSDNLIVEARSLDFLPGDPPQLVGREEDTQATQIYFIY